MGREAAVLVWMVAQPKRKAQREAQRKAQRKTQRKTQNQLTWAEGGWAGCNKGGSGKYAERACVRWSEWRARICGEVPIAGRRCQHFVCPMGPLSRKYLFFHTNVCFASGRLKFMLESVGPAYNRSVYAERGRGRGRGPKLGGAERLSDPR